MATLTAQFKLFSLTSRFLTTRVPIFIAQNGYAKASKLRTEYFSNPVYRKEQQAALVESGELSKMSLLPVRAPGPHQTCSVYHDDLVNKVINHVMEKGKKQLARQLVEKSLENIKRAQIERYHLATTPDERARIVLDPKTVLHQAIANVRPLLQMTPVKRGGIMYQVPGPISDNRSLFLAIKWLLDAANDKERTMHFPETFAWELLEASNNTGKVVKRKQDLHRQCEANRAYAHYRW